MWWQHFNYFTKHLLTKLAYLVQFKRDYVIV